MTYSGEFLKNVSDGNYTLSWMDSWKNWGNQPTMGGSHGETQSVVAWLELFMPGSFKMIG